MLDKVYNQWGLIRELFIFGDANQLISKLTIWDEHDKTIKQGFEKFNNSSAAKVAVDKQAHFAGKGNNKYWHGYKEYVSVDIRSSLIN